MGLENKKFKVKGCNTTYTIGFLNDGDWPITWTNSNGEYRYDRKSEAYMEAALASGDWYLIGEDKELKTEAEHTGGSVNYYKVHVANPTTLPEAYDAEANDIIESLGLTFAEGNLFKAIWRMAADRNGKKKKGNNSVYDAEKLVFFAERVLVQEKAKNESE